MSRRATSRKVKKLVLTVRNGFSRSHPAGSAVHQCKSKPCNLMILRLTEQKADCSGREQVRAVQIQAGHARSGASSPIFLDNGDKFQITAHSQANGEAREVALAVNTEADCTAAVHPLVEYRDWQSSASKVAKNATLKFFRDSMPGDDSMCGLFAMLNAVFQSGTVQYPVSTESCGVPKSQNATGTSLLRTVIEVFPGDEYSAELSFPAFLKPDSLDYTKATESWTTQQDKDKEKIDAAGEEADRIYKSERQFFNEIGSNKAEFRQFAEDQEKRRIGYTDSPPEGLKVKITQKDGDRVLQADVDDAIKLIRLIRNAEYRLKELNHWIDTLQVGPGVRFKVDCQFLILKLKANWGYTEYTDERVFMRYSGSADIDIIKAGLDLSLGFKSAGLCDLLLVIKGEGTIGITVPELKKENPDDAPTVNVKPRGELTLSGGVEGTAMWVAKVTGTVQVTFKADTEDLRLLTSDGILSGRIVVSRDKVEGVITASCRVYGTRTGKVTLVKADPNLAHFEF